MIETFTENKVSRCYFCDSPFQIFTSIHLELSENNVSDIYISDNFDGCSELCERLRSTKLFNNVVAIQCKQNKLKNRKIRRLKFWTDILLSYLTLTKKVKGFLVEDRDYNEMYFSCHSLHMRLARLYFMKTRPDMKFVMFDEGVGSYLDQFERKSKINRLLESAVTRGASDKVKVTQKLYKPELYYKYNAENSMIESIKPVCQIDMINRNIYEYVFDYHITDFDHQIKCIYFDGLRNDPFLTKEEFDEMQQWYQVIEDTVGADHMVLKSHPRATETYPHKCVDFPKSTCPFEVILLGLDIKNIIMISTTSSAVATPKLLFDAEPCVIVLANLYQKRDLMQKPLDFYKRVKELYTDKNNFCIPRSMEELKENLISHL